MKELTHNYDERYEEQDNEIREQVTMMLHNSTTTWHVYDIQQVKDVTKDYEECFEHYDQLFGLLIRTSSPRIYHSCNNYLYQFDDYFVLIEKEGDN